MTFFGIKVSKHFDNRLPVGCPYTLKQWQDFFNDLRKLEATKYAKEARTNPSHSAYANYAPCWDAAAKAFNNQEDILAVYNGCLAYWYYLLPSGEGELCSARHGQMFVAMRYSGIHIPTHGITNENEVDMMVHWNA